MKLEGIWLDVKPSLAFVVIITTEAGDRVAAKFPITAEAARALVCTLVAVDGVGDRTLQSAVNECVDTAIKTQDEEFLRDAGIVARPPEVEQ